MKHREVLVLDQVKHLLGPKDEDMFTPIGGAEKMYSMMSLGQV